MTDKTAAKPAAPGFVVLRQIGNDTWQLLGEVPRKRGLPARAARTQGDPRCNKWDGEAYGGLCGCAPERMADRTGLVRRVRTPAAALAGW
jgi:hypothetical protein